MKCSVAECQQEVMPEIDRESSSIPHLYAGACIPDKKTVHWGFPTYHKDKPLCYYHRKKTEGCFTQVGRFFR